MTNNNKTHMNDNTVKGRPASPEEVAYRDGYIRGRATEDQAQNQQRHMDDIRAEQMAQARANESASSGLLAGLLIAIIAACIGGGAYYFTRDTEPATTEAPVERETTIIERTVENNREIIQNPPEVNLPDIQVPEVDVTVPETPLTNSSEPVEATGEEKSAERSNNKATAEGISESTPSSENAESQVPAE